MPPSLRPTHPQRRGMHKPFITSVLQSLLQAMLLVLIVMALVGRFEVEQTSMAPTLQPGQRVMVNRLSSALPPLVGQTAHASGEARGASTSLQRGEVVVFYEKAVRHAGSIPLIKRLIGLPGETIEITNGEVLINGNVLDEPYLDGISTPCYDTYCGPITLGPDEYFFIGDNRPNSRDSRNFGPVSADQMVGEVMLRYWPLTSLTFEL